MSLPAWQTDDAAILRALQTDSETLRYAEWWVRRRIYGLSDEESRWLVQRFIEARSSLIAGLTDSGFTAAQKDKLLSQIDDEIDALMQDVSDSLLQAQIKAYRQGFVGRVWGLDTATRPDVNIKGILLPAEAIRAAVLSPYLGKNWAEELGWERDEWVAKIKRAIVTSLIAGEGVDKAKFRLDDLLGAHPGQKNAFKGLMYRTLLIAKTELLRASNLGALSIYEQNGDILRGWEWAAARDGRVCSRCQAYDGKVYEFGDPQLVPPSGSHPGCRCTPLPVLRDMELMNKMGTRVTYKQWAAEQGVDLTTDGGLVTQKTSDVHGVNAA